MIITSAKDTPADCIGRMTKDYATFIGSPFECFSRAAEFINQGYMGTEEPPEIECTFLPNEDGDYVLTLIY